MLKILDIFWTKTFALLIYFSAILQSYQLGSAKQNQRTMRLHFLSPEIEKEITELLFGPSSFNDV